MSNVQKDIQTTQSQLDNGELTRGAADRVPRGDEKDPPAKLDPFAARKAMFIKADQLRETEAANGVGADPAMIAALQAEAGGGDPAAAAPVTPSGASAPAAPAGQAANTYVTIPVEGGEIRVTQADVDREGGTTAYLRRRQSDEVTAQAQIENARLQRELAESNRLRETLQAQLAAQGTVPATSPARSTGQGESPGASEQELTELASQLATQIYSGDENDAKAAILAILQRTRGQTLSVEDIERRIREAAKVPAATTPNPTANTVPVNPRMQAINAQINDMAAREYADVCNDNVAREATFAYFKQLVNLPENRDRRAVDVARDACEWGRAKFVGIDPRSKIVEQKRGLPSSHVASGAQPASTDEEVLTPSQVVAQQQRFRSFGKQIH